MLQRAVEADQLAEAASVSSDSDLAIDLDATGETEEERRRLRKEQEALHASSRPPWHMTVQELDANERQAFLVWHRNLATLEENDKLVLTHFETLRRILTYGDNSGECLNAVTCWLRWLMLGIFYSTAALILRTVCVVSLSILAKIVWICRHKRINVLLQPNSCVMEGLTLGQLREGTTLQLL